MDTTELLYLSDFNLLTTNASVINIEEREGKLAILLDKTVFYPQGGGQPYDTGQIQRDSVVFGVSEVRFIDGVVFHIGSFSNGIINKGDLVTCIVDKDRRILNSKLHSAGHVVDMAVTKLHLPWTPVKAYHFPNGAYVEYAGMFNEEDKERLKAEIDRISNEIVAQDLQVTIRFMDKQDMFSVCHFVPDNIPENKPARVILFGDFGIPCGGTHVNHLGELNGVTIRKVKSEKGIIRVGYDLV